MFDESFPENDEQQFNEENQEYSNRQEVQTHNEEVETLDNENLAENDQILFEISEHENEIIIQSGNTQTIYKGQLVEDKEGGQYILTDGQMISLHDVLSDDALKEGVQVYVKEEEVSGELPEPETGAQKV